MLKNDDVCLRHILDAAREAIAFSSNRLPEDLNRDRMLNLSRTFVRSNRRGCQGYLAILPYRSSWIPWEKMVGMRDRLIHGYFDINLDLTNWKGF